MIYANKPKACASDEPCSQEARPGYKLCWHHHMATEARGWSPKPSLYYLLIELIEEMEQEQFRDPDDYSEDTGTGCFFLRSIEDCREFEEGDQSDERPEYETLEEAMRHIPDMEDARCSGYDSFCGFVHVWAGYDLVALVHFRWSENDEVQP